MFTMLLNHIANIFLEPGTLLFEIFVDVGYFTAITMCYFLVEGYGYTRSKEKYGKRLFLFAAISEIPFCLAFTEEGTISFVNMNMMFTLFLCFLILVVREKVQADWRRNACIIVLVVLSIYSDWALLAPLFTLWFATCGLTDAQGKIAEDFTAQRRKKLWKVFGNAMLLFGLVNLAENIETMSPGMSILRSLGAVAGIFLSAVCIIYLYNGQQGKKYRTFSNALGLMERIRPILEGIPLKYQIWETGAASSICPILSRLTFAFVTSTPQRSQTTPL